tara:strand:- start:266 stop:574 length:309 start_codon:yes stop_codon:yes gene_type:complete
MIKFIEVINKTEKNPRLERTAIPQFDMQEVWINEEFVVNLREATGYTKLLREGRLPADLNQQHRFTAVTTNAGGISETCVVIGDLTVVANRLSRDTATLLKG